jgi:hypothetical protein
MIKLLKKFTKYIKKGFTFIVFGAIIKPVSVMGMRETCTLEPMQPFLKKIVIQKKYKVSHFLKNVFKEGLTLISSNIKPRRNNLSHQIMLKFSKKEEFLVQPFSKRLENELKIQKDFRWKRYFQEKKYLFLSNFSYLIYNTTKLLKKVIELIQKLKKKKKYLAWILLSTLFLLGIILGFYFRKLIFSFLKETFRKRNLRKWKKIFKNWKKNFTWENFLNKLLYWFEEVGSEEFEFIDPKNLTQGREIPKAPSGYTGTYSETP